ncbi:MAG: hypothetical protein ACYC4L_03585 [Chloroflexota bacterium]
MNEREPSPEDADDLLAVPPQFFFPATIGVFLLVLVLLATALPGGLGLPSVALAVTTPTSLPRATAVYTPTPLPMRVILPTPTLTPTITPTPVPGRFRVANTGGDGAAIRPEPKRSSPLLWGWADNTVVEEVGPEVDGDGAKWRHVRDPRGNTGYMLSQYLQLVPPTG